MNIYIRPNGTAQCLYGEDIDLSTLGSLDIKRASHVEPNEEKPGEWMADLSPVGGPLFTGFKCRAAALAAEDKWLNEKMTQHNVSVVQNGT
jgi:hypothetical protein